MGAHIDCGRDLWIFQDPRLKDSNHAGNFSSRLGPIRPPKSVGSVLPFVALPLRLLRLTPAMDSSPQRSLATSCRLGGVSDMGPILSSGQGEAAATTVVGTAASLTG